MARDIIRTTRAPASPPTYSQAVRAAGLVFVSGTGPHDPVTGKIVGETIQQQTRQCLTNVSAILEAAVIDRDGRRPGHQQRIGVVATGDPVELVGALDEASSLVEAAGCAREGCLEPLVLAVQATSRKRLHGASRACQRIRWPAAAHFPRDASCSAARWHIAIASSSWSRSR